MHSALPKLLGRFNRKLGCDRALIYLFTVLSELFLFIPENENALINDVKERTLFDELRSLQFIFNSFNYSFPL